MCYRAVLLVPNNRLSVSSAKVCCSARKYHRNTSPNDQMQEEFRLRRKRDLEGKISAQKVGLKCLWITWKKKKKQKLENTGRKIRTWNILEHLQHVCSRSDRCELPELRNNWRRCCLVGAESEGASRCRFAVAPSGL